MHSFANFFETILKVYILCDDYDVIFCFKVIVRNSDHRLPPPLLNCYFIVHVNNIYEWHYAISFHDLAFYGVDFNCPEPVYEDGDIVVPTLLQLEQEAFKEIRERAEQLVDTLYEVQTFLDICTRFTNLQSGP